MDLTTIKTIDDLDLRGQRVLIRVDINVPIRDGLVTDDTRIRAIVPTVRDVLASGGKPILAAHLGRPKGQVVDDLSLSALADPLQEALASDVVFAGAVGSDEARAAIEEQADGETLLLENVRFHAGEEANDPEFAKALAALADIYINDAFSAAHRAHASTEGVAHLLPSAAGRQMQAELAALGAALEDPTRPVAAVVGGAKVSTKIDVLTHLVTKVDKLIVGGGMANTFLLAKGHGIGKSLAEADLVETAHGIMTGAEASGCRILLPIDATCALEFAEGASHRVATLDDIGSEEMVLDVGPRSVAELTAELATCRTLVWNGPLGAFEINPFGAGTFALARAAADLTKSGELTSVAGGGDTVAALNAAGVTDDFSYISTAGGAFLEWLEGRELPGIAALARS